MASKRTASSNHAAATSPFKRLKAKVGKKAPKALNATDTNFRSASIHIQNQETGLQQQQQKAAGRVLASSRGRLLTELLSQMHHPAAAVRMSAMKGVQDIVQQNGSNSPTISSNLSLFISAIGKASVEEEDQDIRLIGLEVFQKLLKVLSHPAIWKPFMPLTLAFLQSALNSLDRDTRKDGLQYLHSLARTVPLNVATVITILPAIVRMWDDKAFLPQGEGQGGKKQNHKKRNKKQTQTQQQSKGNEGFKSKRFPLLDCLDILLTGIGVDDSSQSSSHGRDLALALPTMTLVSGAASKNALFFYSLHRETNRSSHDALSKTLESMTELPSFSSLSSSHGNYNHQPTRAILRGEAFLDLDCAHNLLVKFRDTLIELQQTPCYVTLHLLAKVLELFWHVFGTQLVSDSMATKSKEPKGTNTIGAVMETIRKLCMENFPVQSLSAASTNGAMLESLNGQLCLTLVLVTHAVDELTTPFTNAHNRNQQKQQQQQQSSEGSSTKWLKPVVQYLCDRLTDKSLVRPGNEESRQAILKVLQKLLKDAHYCKILQANPRLEKKLVQAFMGSIMPQSGALAHGSTERSRQTRLISVEIMTTILKRSKHCLRPDEAASVGDIMFQITTALSDILVVLGADDLDSSAKVLSSLSLIFRRFPSSDEMNNHKDNAFAKGVVSVTSKLRLTIEAIVDPEGITDKNGTKHSIFESYSEPMQRSLLNLLATLQSPTEHTCSHLSDICARANLTIIPDKVSPNVCFYVVQVIFDIRKTIPMQQFLGFLVDCTGVTRASLPDNANTTVPDSRMDRFDRGVKAVTKSLVCCGVHKVTPMMIPLLQLFLENDTSSSATLTQALVRQRFAFSVMAEFAHTLRKNGRCESLLPLLTSELEGKIPVRILEVLQKPGTYNDHGKVKPQTMTPITALLRTEPSLLAKVFQYIIDNIMSVEEEIHQRNILTWLVEQDRLIASLPVAKVHEFMDRTKEVQAATSSSQMSNLFEQLSVVLGLAMSGTQMQ